MKSLPAGTWYMWWERVLLYFASLQWTLTGFISRGMAKQRSLWKVKVNCRMKSPLREHSKVGSLDPPVIFSPWGWEGPEPHVGSRAQGKPAPAITSVRHRKAFLGQVVRSTNSHLLLDLLSLCSPADSGPNCFQLANSSCPVLLRARWLQAVSRQRGVAAAYPSPAPHPLREGPSSACCWNPLIQSKTFILWQNQGLRMPGHRAGWAEHAAPTLRIHAAAGSPQSCQFGSSV